MKIARSALFALLIAAPVLPALAADSVVWDSSGNGLLNGTFNFREVMWGNKGDLHRIAIYGTLVFDGNGRYTLNSSVMDSAIGSVQSFSTAGAYRIAASGMGFMDDPIRLSATSPSSTVWGTVSQGIFVGSSTDDGVNSLFIAALAPSPAPGNSSFNGSYRTVAVNIPSTNVSQVRDMQFPLNPNGQGGLGAVALTGFIGGSGATVTETVNNAIYSFDGSGALTLGFGGTLATQPLLAGNVLCYLTGDANFFFGGSPTGWDMIVGVRAFAGNVPPSALKGLYYQAGADVTIAGGFNTLATYYGALSADSGTIVGHQRILTADPATQFKPFDFTYSDGFALAADGKWQDSFGFQYFVGAGGAIQIGYGVESRLGINIGLRAPDFTGSGVYLSPTGLANAASSAPFTVGVSRGGFIALYGSGLASTTLQNDKMPFNLGGVQVLINGRMAPVYFVRSDVVLAIVPFATTGSIASIQVINNGSASAIRTVRIKDSTPGVYTNPPGGVAYAIAQHINSPSFPVVTPQNPARPGETILLYVNGLGDVNPSVADGTPAPSNPLSNAVTQPLVVIDHHNVTPSFAGLSPTLIGVYAMTFTIPSDLTPGDVYLDISFPDSYTTEAQLPIGGSNTASAPTDARSLRRADETAPPPGSLRRLQKRR